MNHGFRLAALVACLAAPAFAQTTWQMPTEYPETAMPGAGVAFFADQVKELSDGNLIVQPSFDGDMGIVSEDMIAAVEEGRVKFGDAFGGALRPVDPIFGLSSLPFVTKSIDEAKRLADIARPAYEEALAARGQKLLYLTPWPASGIWSTGPLNSVADLEALKIRTYDDTSTEVLAAAGATSTKMSWTDALPMLQDGTVNAALTSGDGGAGRKLWDMLPHFAEVTYAMPLSFATVNTQAYSSLSPDLRDAVDRAAAATEEYQWTAIRSRVDENSHGCAKTASRFRPRSPRMSVAPSETRGRVPWQHEKRKLLMVLRFSRNSTSERLNLDRGVRS